MWTLATGVQFDLIGWHTPQLLSTCAISDGAWATCSLDKNCMFSIRENVWQPDVHVYDFSLMVKPPPVYINASYLLVDFDSNKQIPKRQGAHMSLDTCR